MGSKLYLTLEGEQVEIWVDGKYTGFNRLEATYTILGGSGRFDGASGSGIVRALINVEDRIFWGYVRGEIIHFSVCLGRCAGQWSS